MTAMITTMIRIVVKPPSPPFDVDLVAGGVGAVTVTDTVFEADEPSESFAQNVAV